MTLNERFKNILFVHKLSTKEERDDAHLSNRRSLFMIEGCDINFKGCNE